MSDQQLQQQRQTRRGCMFYGCIVGIVLMLMLLAGVLFGLHQFKKMMNQFTDSRPMALPAVNLSPSQLDALRQRVNTFSNAVSTGKAAAPLVLNSDEVNALIAENPGSRNLSNKVYVSLQEDKVKAQVSLPMGETGIRLFRGRYLNGDATLSVSLRQTNLTVFINDVNVKGKPLPGVYMDTIRTINWAEGANTNRNGASALNKIQSIDVKDGKLVITPVEGPEKSQ